MLAWGFNYLLLEQLLLGNTTVVISNLLTGVYSIMSERTSLPCRNLFEFKEALLSWRKIDDVIIYRLNTSLPVRALKENELDRSRQCKELLADLESNHAARKTAITECLKENEKIIHELSQQKSTGDTKAGLEMKKEMTKLRLIQGELGVEDVIKSRTMKVFHERCWSFYPNITT